MINPEERTDGRSVAAVGRSPQRIQRRRTRGWRMPEGAVNVTRPADWCNQFRVGSSVRMNGFNGPNVYVDRELAVDLFRAWVRGMGFEAQIREELAGKNLVCWCALPAPGEPDLCHAAVLLAIANPPVPAVDRRNPQ